MAWLFSAAVWLSLVGGGCNLFEPAQPEPPNSNAILADYRDPDRTLQMIALALHDKALTNGTSVYMGAFADSALQPIAVTYHHFFWPDDVSSWGGTPPSDWDPTEELNFYSKFVNLFPADYQMYWTVDETLPDDVRETRAVIHRHYEVVTQTPDGTITGTVAIGFADLTLVKGADNNWRIVIWSDRADPAADPGADQVSLGRRRLGTLSQ